MKELSCKDLGASCDWKVKAETEEELRKLALEHGRKDHDLKEITDEFWQKAKTAIREV